MISFALACTNGHRFDAWFRTADAYDAQVEAGIVTCPDCGSADVGKALMAPAIARKSAPEPMPVPVAAAGPEQVGMGMPSELVEVLRALKQKVTSKADYVGDRFAEEARRIHFKEAEARGIYGEATREEVAGLLEDGIEVMPLPRLPDEAN